MMISVLVLLIPALTLAAFGSLLATWVHMANHPDKYTEKWANRISWFSFGLYFVWILMLSIYQRQIPFITVGQLAALQGFLIWTAHLYIQRKIEQGILVVLPLLAVVFMILISIILGTQNAIAPEMFRGFWVGLHIAFSMGGVALLLGTGVYGMGYLVLHQRIKKRKFGPFYSLMPSLGDLNYLRSTTLVTGWSLISAGMVAGTIWMLKHTDFYSLLKGHLGIALVFWVIIAIVSAASKFKLLGQRKLAAFSVLLSAVIFVLIVISIIVTYPGESV
ncbi:MAG: hypothetical protein V3W18_06670 [candidate division Zixibacteria bacterium]